jgi:hypothetical protein
MVPTLVILFFVGFRAALLHKALFERQVSWKDFDWSDFVSPLVFFEHPIIHNKFYLSIPDIEITLILIHSMESLGLLNAVV